MDTSSVNKASADWKEIQSRISVQRIFYCAQAQWWLSSALNARDEMGVENPCKDLARAMFLRLHGNSLINMLPPWFSRPSLIFFLGCAPSIFRLGEMLTKWAVIASSPRWAVIGCWRGKISYFRTILLKWNWITTNSWASITRVLQSESCRHRYSIPQIKAKYFNYVDVSQQFSMSYWSSLLVLLIT